MAARLKADDCCQRQTAHVHVPASLLIGEGVLLLAWPD